MIERENSSRQPVGALLKGIAAFCGSVSLSEDGLRGIIEGLEFATNNNDPGIDYKFFHEACRNERVTEAILRYLLHYFPNAAKCIDANGFIPLHRVCENKNVTLDMVQLLIDAHPDSLSYENNIGRMPLHCLCDNKNLDDEVGLEILKFVERFPEAVRHAANSEDLPIHIAARRQSPEFCRLLIEAYPGSEQITNEDGFLPFHFACGNNTVATAKYLYQLYPESISVAANNGFYPIHYAMLGITYRKDKPEIAIYMVRFLLDCDPDVLHLTYQGKLPLYWVCYETTNTYSQMVSLNLLLKALKMLYDAYPEAIERNEVTSDIGRFCEEVKTFIRTQLTYARQARDRTLMTTRDENGQLPLHRALRDNVTLGSIKLLVKRHPSSITCADNSGMLPLHIAFQHNDSASIVEYLLDLDPSTSRALDFDDNAVLHYACRDANHAIISLLLDKYGSMSVSKRNTYGQLPIHLLLESNEVSNREDIKYTESIYRLLRANPQTIMNSI